MSLRIEKINSEIQKHITQIIREQIDDPVMDLFSITRVDTTVDLKECKVYFSLLDDTKYKQAKHVLDTMAKFIRMHLGKRIQLKFLPDLRFIVDDSIRYSVDIYKKIEDLKQKPEQTEEGHDK
jgi:ribosome-binding factor A